MVVKGRIHWILAKMVRGRREGRTILKSGGRDGLVLTKGFGEGEGVVWTKGLGEGKGNDRQKSCGRERGSMD
jgi:hypothetical protein